MQVKRGGVFPSDLVFLSGYGDEGVTNACYVQVLAPNNMLVCALYHLTG